MNQHAHGCECPLCRISTFSENAKTGSPPAAGSELLPCPFCGEPSPRPAPRMGFPVHVLCPNCGATGPGKLTAQEADREWNKRTGPDMDAFREARDYIQSPNAERCGSES